MFTVTRIRKKNGGVRLIYKPGRKLRQRIAHYMDALIQRMLDVCDYRICHGFMPGRSPSTNASYHIGFNYSISFDLSSYFDTITAQHLRKYVDDDILSTCLIDGSPRQGLPSSPALANIAGVDMDTALAGLGLRYTRYADDLTFSTNNKYDIPMLLERVPQVVDSYGFSVNKRKTHVQGFRAGRRRITGVCVGDDDVYEPRKNRRKRRAAEHQKHAGSVNGLAAWHGSPNPFCPICLSKCQSIRSWQSVVGWLWVHLSRVHDIDIKERDLNDMMTMRGHILDFADAFYELRSLHLMQALSAV